MGGGKFICGRRRLSASGSGLFAVVDNSLDVSVPAARWMMATCQLTVTDPLTAICRLLDGNQPKDGDSQPLDGGLLTVVETAVGTVACWWPW